MITLRATRFLWAAIAVAVLSAIALPLAHLDASHDENCPLCNPLSLNALICCTDTVQLVLTAPSIVVAPIEVDRIHLACTLCLAGRAPPAPFTT